MNRPEVRLLKENRDKEKSKPGGKPGVLFIISAPSGAGKSTLCHAVLKRFADLVYSVSYTTRSPRGGECNGRDYHFIAKEEFEKGIAAGRWAEWAEVHQHYYGTSAEVLDRELTAGRDILLDIDVQGMQQIRRRFPQAVTIFIMPPSLEILKARLLTRGTDSAEDIAVRLDNAREEMARKDTYRHIIVNDHLTEAVSELVALFESYRA